MTIVCKNCNNHFKGKFCSHCGQAADTHDINMHYLWHEIQHGVFHFDSGIFYTVKQLFTRPGHAIREFINGKRVKFFKPFAFVFVLSTIYALLMHYFDIQGFYDVEVGKDDIGNVQSKELLGNFNHIYSWIGSHYSYYILLSLPVVSLTSYFAFRNKRINYLKHIVLNAYIVGQKTIVYLLFIPVSILTKFVINGSDIQNFIEVLIPAWTYTQFFNYNSLWTGILRTILSYIYYYLIGFALLAVYFYVFVYKLAF